LKSAVPKRAEEKAENEVNTPTLTTGIEPTAKHRVGRNAPGGPPGNKKAVKHGLYSYKAMLEGKGLDERTSLFRALREKERELVTALGGDPSPQEQAVIADTVKNMLYVASLDNYLMGLKSLVRKGKAHPVLAIRTQLAAHLREDLKTLGLARRVKATSINDLLSEPTAAEANGTTHSQGDESNNESRSEIVR
jgi:hypothetical protein